MPRETIGGFRRDKTVLPAEDTWLRQADSLLRQVGSFCCPVLPEPLDSASVARCGPNRA